MGWKELLEALKPGAGSKIINDFAESRANTVKNKVSEIKSGFSSLSEPGLGITQDYINNPINRQQMFADMLDTAMIWNPASVGTIVGKSAKGFAGMKKVVNPRDPAPRAEISDHLMSAKNFERNMPEIDRIEYGEGDSIPMTLKDVVNHPELFKAYPEIQDMVTLVNKNAHKGGGYSPELNRIRVSIDPETGLVDTGILLHEVQHAIQNKEGFQSGANPDQVTKEMLDQLPTKVTNDVPTGKKPLTAYVRTAGEIEARDTAARQYLTPQERTELPAYESQGYPPDDWVTKPVNSISKGWDKLKSGRNHAR